MAIFYTYLWLREDGTPYYVGKGTGRRAFVKKGHTCSPPSEDHILLQEFPDESSALEAEKFLISLYGRRDLGTGCLRNLTDGGDGVLGSSRPPHLGHLHSAEAKLKMRIAKLGKKRGSPSFETRLKIAVANTGSKHSTKARAKMRLSRLGKKPWNTGLKLLYVPHKVVWSIASKEAARGRMLGKKLSEETRAKMRAAQQERYHGDIN